MLTPVNPGKLAHIIVVIQENRTVNNLFNGFPGIDTVQSGPLKGPQPTPTPIALVAAPLNAWCDPLHRYEDFALDVDYQMNANPPQFLNDNFTQTSKLCPSNPPPPQWPAYSYVQSSDVQNYYAIASDFAFGTHVLQMSMGASFQAHQYLIAGQSGSLSGLASSTNKMKPRGYNTLSTMRVCLN